MAAASTLPQERLSRKLGIEKTGVLTLSGFGIHVRMRCGHLEIQDGVGMERRSIRLPRVGQQLKRLVVIGSDGYVSLAALQWLCEQGASFVMLERNGKVRCVTGPVQPSEARLRRAQALAAENGVGLEVVRTLLEAKLRGEEQLLRERLNCEATAEVVSEFRKKLETVETFDAIRVVEANAAACYFREWRDVPVMWPKSDISKIPDHWRVVGGRQSPITGGPRLAVTPVHAILNYCFALLEAETRLAVSASGLDPGLGLGLHTDTANRDSLALDVLEPIRPAVEMWLLDWIRNEPFRRGDFFETGTGNCRLMSQLCKKLSQTSSVWRKLVAPWAEYVAEALWETTRSRTHRSLPTRLTQWHRRQAKGKLRTENVQFSKMDHVCRDCGKKIDKRSVTCADCAVGPARERMVAVAKIGRKTANSPESNRKRAKIQQRNALAQHSWKISQQPRWLTPRFFNREIQPLLPFVSSRDIARQLSVSRQYAGLIRKGYRPHARHWIRLHELVRSKSRG